MASYLVSGDASHEDIWRHQSYAGYNALNAAVVFGIVLWDYIQLLPEEKSLYEKFGGIEWASPAPWAFIVLRYSTLVSTLSGIVYASLQIQDCQLAVSLGQASSVIALVSSGILFGCRVGSLWDYRRIPLTIGSVPYVMMICIWVAVATQYRATPGEYLPFGTNCQFEPLLGWTSINAASTALFNCCVFGLVLARLITKRTIVATNQGFTLINRACVIYLAFSAVSCSIIFIVNAIPLKDDLARRVSTQYIILIAMAMGSRVFLNLQLHNQILSRFEESNHFTAKNWPPEDAETSTEIPMSLQGYEPSFDPSSSMPSSPGGEARSLGTYTTLTALTIPDTPTTAKSFVESAYETPAQSPRATVSSFGNIPGMPRSPRSIKSFAALSIRTKDTVPGIPEIQEVPRVRRLKSFSSVSTRLTGGPPSPRRRPEPSIISFQSASTNILNAPPAKPRRERQESFKYFATTSNLKADELKSTWNGI